MAWLDRARPASFEYMLDRSPLAYSALRRLRIQFSWRDWRVRALLSVISKAPRLEILTLEPIVLDPQVRVMQFDAKALESFTYVHPAFWAVNLFIFPRRVRCLEFLSSGPLGPNFWASLAGQPCGEEVEELRVSTAFRSSRLQNPPITAVPFRNLRILSVTRTCFLADSNDGDEIPSDTQYASHSSPIPPGFDLAVFRVNPLLEQVAIDSVSAEGLSVLANNCRNLKSLVIMDAWCPAIIGAKYRTSDVTRFVERAGSLRFFKFATCKQQRMTPALLRAACQSRSLERLVVSVAGGGSDARQPHWDNQEFRLHLLELEELEVGAFGNPDGPTICVKAASSGVFRPYYEPVRRGYEVSLAGLGSTTLFGYGLFIVDLDGLRKDWDVLMGTRKAMLLRLHPELKWGEGVLEEYMDWYVVDRTPLLFFSFFLFFFFLFSFFTFRFHFFFFFPSFRGTQADYIEHIWPRMNGQAM